MDNSTKLELVWKALGNAQTTLDLTFRKNGQWTDPKMEEYYYAINDMCCEITDRNEMDWQKEDDGQKS